MLLYRKLLIAISWFCGLKINWICFSNSYFWVIPKIFHVKICHQQTISLHTFWFWCLLFCLIALNKTSKKSGVIGHHCFILDFRWKVLNFSLFSVFSFGIVICHHYCVKYTFILYVIFETFYERLSNFSDGFSIFVDVIMWFYPLFCWYYESYLLICIPEIISILCWWVIFL